MDVQKYNWGILEEAGITEQFLSDMFTNDESNQLICRESFLNIPDVPTYGILIELYKFACEHAADFKLEVNRILKVLIDTMFPVCSVSQADRLERRIKGFCVPLDSMTQDEQVVYLQTQWTPQPTGVLPIIASTEN